MTVERHVLGISGGRDSAALAVFMRQTSPDLEIEYFFTDTGKELPEVYEFLGRLEGFLGKTILRLNPDRDFDFWLREYKSFLPSPQTRWCTKQLKIRPFEEWLRPAIRAGHIVNSYVAIRSDEEYREGYVSGQDNLRVERRGSTNQAFRKFLKPLGSGCPNTIAGVLGVVVRFASTSKKSSGHGFSKSILKRSKRQSGTKRMLLTTARPSRGATENLLRSFHDQSALPKFGLITKKESKEFALGGR